MKTRCILPKFFLVCAICLVSFPALGAPGGGGPPTETTISQARADLENGILSVFGLGFGAAPEVLLGTEDGQLDPLSVVFSSDTYVEASLPAIEPGTYLLVVDAGPAQTQIARLDITVGSVGPEGPAGPQGPDGPAGPSGLSCWDLNQNGLCEPVTEDVSGNGACDVDDCQGGAGPQGAVCPPATVLVGFDLGGGLICRPLDALRCGDGALDPNEQCDDGNLISGDGCSSICVIETVCGNGILEPTAEGCDDSNTQNGDGCSSQCSPETELDAARRLIGPLNDLVDSRVGIDADGDFVVIRREQDSSGLDLYATLFSVNNASDPPRLKLNGPYPAMVFVDRMDMAMNEAGDFAVAWESNGTVAVRAVDSNFQLVGPILTLSSGTTGNVDVAMENDNIVVGWARSTTGTTTFNIARLRIDRSTGLLEQVGGITTVASGSFTPEHPTDVNLSGGVISVVYKRVFYTDQNLWVEQYDFATGLQLLAGTSVNVASDQIFDITLSGNADGSMVVAWTDSGGSLFVQRVDPSGSLVGGPVLVSIEAGFNDSTSLLMTTNDDFKVVWWNHPPEIPVLKLFCREVNGGIPGQVGLIDIGYQDPSTGYGRYNQFPTADINDTGDLVIVWGRYSASGEIEEGDLARSFSCF